MYSKLAYSVILLAITPGISRGDDFVGEDFSLRLPSALSGFSVYADVAAKGGASSASKFGSSINPAAMAWYFPKVYDYGLSAQYSNVAFQEGTHLDFVSAAATFDLHDFGAIRVSLGQVSSNDRAIRGVPVVFTYDLNAVRLNWGKKWGDWAVGAGFSYAYSVTSFRPRQFVFSESERSASTGQLGLQWQPVGNWLVGLVGEYGYAPTHTDYLLPRSERDITRQLVVRPGIAWEWQENALIQLDYQYGQAWNRTGSLDKSRFSVGADLPLAKFLIVRAGAAVDVRENFAWTVGFGFYPKKGVTFDFAYQDDVFPELQPEFGHSRTLNASVSVQF